MPRPAIAFDKIKFNLPDSITLSGDLEHLFEHSCPNPKVPKLLQKCDCNRCSMAVFLPGPKGNLTISSDSSVHNTGNHHRVFILVSSIQKVLFLRLIKEVPGLGVLQLYGQVDRQMTGYFSPNIRHI